MRQKEFYVYIMASKFYGTLYIGVTSNLFQRVQKHKMEYYESFSKRYLVKKLVHYEYFPDALSAIKREKQLKKWKRWWKIQLIEEKNSEWKDLSKEYFDLLYE